MPDSNKKKKKENLETRLVSTDNASIFWSDLYLAVQILLPLALAALLFSKKFSIQPLHNYASVLWPSVSQKQRLLSWLSTRIPYMSNIPKKISQYWKDGSLLCTLINTAIPGACPNPQRHWKQPPIHAQALAYKYFGVEPALTSADFAERNLTLISERKFVNYLLSLQEVILNISVDTDSLKFTNNYIARGMGLIVGEQSKTSTFYIYPNANSEKLDNIFISLKGPYSSYGKQVISSTEMSMNAKRMAKLRKEASDERDKLAYKSSSQRYLFKPLSIIDIGPIFGYLSKDGKSGDIPIRIEMEKERAKVTFVPRHSGMYELLLTSNDEHIHGSPFVIRVTKPCEDEPRSLKEDPLMEKKKIVAQSIDFIDESVDITEDNKVFLKLDQNNNRSAENMKNEQIEAIEIIQMDKGEKNETQQAPIRIIVGDCTDVQKENVQNEEKECKHKRGYHLDEDKEFEKIYQENISENEDTLTNFETAMSDFCEDLTDDDQYLLDKPVKESGKSHESNIIEEFPGFVRGGNMGELRKMIMEKEAVSKPKAECVLEESVIEEASIDENSKTEETFATKTDFSEGQVKECPSSSTEDTLYRLENPSSGSDQENSSKVDVLSKGEDSSSKSDEPSENFSLIIPSKIEDSVENFTVRVGRESEDRIEGRESVSAESLERNDESCEDQIEETSSKIEEESIKTEKLEEDEEVKINSSELDLSAISENVSKIEINSVVVSDEGEDTLEKEDISPLKLPLEEKNRAESEDEGSLKTCNDSGFISCTTDEDSPFPTSRGTKSIKNMVELFENNKLNEDDFELNITSTISPDIAQEVEVVKSERNEEEDSVLRVDEDQISGSIQSDNVSGVNVFEMKLKFERRIQDSIPITKKSQFSGINRSLMKKSRVTFTQSMPNLVTAKDEYEKERFLSSADSTNEFVMQFKEKKQFWDKLVESESTASLGSNYSDVENLEKWKLSDREFPVKSTRSLSSFPRSEENLKDTINGVNWNGVLDRIRVFEKDFDSERHSTVLKRTKERSVRSISSFKSIKSVEALQDIHDLMHDEPVEEDLQFAEESRRRFENARHFFRSIEQINLTGKLEGNQSEVKSHNSPRRSVSLKTLSNVQDRFALDNLYRDVIFNKIKNGSLKGSPNRDGVIGTLASISSTESGLEKDFGDEDDVDMNYFRIAKKPKRRKSVKSLFEVNY